MFTTFLQQIINSRLLQVVIYLFIFFFDRLQVVIDWQKSNFIGKFELEQ